MSEFVKKLMEPLIEQLKLETKEKKTNTSNNDGEFEISTSYQEVLDLAVEVNLKIAESVEKISKKVKKMINRMEVKMNTLFKNFEIAPTEIKFDDIATLATAYYNLGCICIYKEDNLNAAKNHFMKCIQLLEGKELNYKVILVAIQVCLDLNIVWKKLQQLDNCYPLLDKALELYLNYTKEEDDYPEPYNFMCNNDNINTKILLIKCYIATLSYMENLYWLQPANMHKFVTYVHNLLNKQLKTIKNSTENHMFLCWANASTDLSMYFLHQDRFMEAKIHLAAADYMIAMHYILIATDPEFCESTDAYKIAYVSTTQHWAIYGIMLLRSSKERLLQYKSNKSCEANNIKSESHPKSEEELMKPLTFVDLEKNLEKIDKYHITDTYISNFDDIKIIFANVLIWLNIVYLHFSTTKQFMYQVQTILYMSKAYKYYVYFEGDTNKRMKTIKLQILMLKTFINALSSQCSTLAERNYYKVLQFELAITYSTFLDMTVEELEEVEEITDETRTEIKQLIGKIIDAFKLSTNIH